MTNQKMRARNRAKKLDANANGFQVDKLTAKTRDQVLQQEAGRNNGQKSIKPPASPASSVSSVKSFKPAAPLKTFVPGKAAKPVKPAKPTETAKPFKPVEPAKESSIKLLEQPKERGKPNKFKDEKAIANARNRIIEQEARRNNSQKPLQPVKKSAIKLTDLPKEILANILKHVLVHQYPIPVDPMFARQNKDLKPALDYRILHLHPALYQAGLPLYYSLNTFNIALSMFRVTPRSLAPDRWPIMCGRVMASMHVRSVHVSARKGDWEDSVKLLRGFQKLDKVVFDGRSDLVNDNHKEGGMLRAAWIEVPAPQQLVDLLKKAGITVGDGGVWMGGTKGWGDWSEPKEVIKPIDRFLTREAEDRL